MDGWPGRAGRINYGPTMRDERPTVNSSNEFNMAQANLLFWQAGGLGLCAPKATFHFTAGDGLFMSFGVLAWDPVIYGPFDSNDAPPAIESFTINGDGDYSIVFATDVPGRPNEDGDQDDVPLTIAGGMVEVEGKTLSQRMFGEFELVSAQEVRIRIYKDATPTHASFTLAVW